MLACSISEDTTLRIAAVNDWLDEDEQLPMRSVWECDAAVGGSKNMDAPVYAGAFNAFDLRGFLMHLRTLPWNQPAAVQVMICADLEERGG